MKKTILTAAMAGALLYGAQVSADNINGITLETGAQLWTTTLWEHALTGVYDPLYGVGIVRDVTGPSGTTWSDGDNNTQLTYYFHDYNVLAWYEGNGTQHTSADSDWGTVAGDTAFTTNAVAIDFSGGVVDMYTDSILTGTLLDPSTSASKAEDVAEATDGTLWMTWQGHQYDIFTLGLGNRTGGTLYATNTQGSNIHASGSGAGYLDAFSGPAYDALNTDGFDPNLDGNLADGLIDSSYSTTNPANWDLSGSLTLKTNADVPEPGVLVLLGGGLLGMGFVQRRRKIAKNT